MKNKSLDENFLFKSHEGFVERYARHEITQ